MKPWKAGTVCPDPNYVEFSAALERASYHFADDSGGEWGEAGKCMELAAQIAIDAAWPYWAMKRIHKEIAPLPTFDAFMEAHCRLALARAKASDT